MKLTTRFELASRSDSDLAQQRGRFDRWVILLAIVWIVLNDDARERECEHKRRLTAQQELHGQDAERRERKRPSAPKPPAP